MSYHLYILCSKKNGVLYIGITNNLERRMFEHKEKMLSGFTKKYRVDKLVYLEEYQDIHEAIAREKALKKWNRQWKINLIESVNSAWEEVLI